MIMETLNSQVVLLIIAALVAIALLTQALVMLAIFLGMRKAAQVARGEYEQWRASFLPFVSDAREFFVRVAPKVEQTSADLAAITHSLRAQSTELESAAKTFLERAHRQASRLEATATAVLDAADRAGAFLTNTFSKPMRQISGILASVRAVIESLRTNETMPRPQATQARSDPEMFV
jgi:methyl-accepting chemotaxis protein